MAGKYDTLIDEVTGTSTQPEVQPVSAPPPQPVSKYGDLIDEVTSSAQLHTSLFDAMDANPQEEARKRKLSKQLNTPVAVLPADAEQRALLQSTDADEIKQKTPATAKFLEDPENARVTGLKGVKSLSAIEMAAKSYSPDNIKQFIRNYTATGKSAAEASQKLSEMKAKGIDLADYNDPYRRNWGEVLPDLGKQIVSGTDQMFAGMAELSRPANRLVQALSLGLGVTSEILIKGAGVPYFDLAKDVRDNLDKTQETLNETAKYWQDDKSTGMKRLNEALAKAGALESVGLLIQHPSLAADQLAQSLPYLAPGAVAARGGEAVMVASNSLIEAADAANSAREEAKAAGATPEQQDKAATVAALVAAPLVFLGNKLLGTGKLEAKFFTKGTTGHSLLQSAVREFIAGSIEEGSNQFGMNLGASTYDESRQLLEGVGKAALLGGVLESTHAVGMTATDRALQAFIRDTEMAVDAANNRVDQAADAEAVQATMADLSTSAANDELRQNDPEAFKAFAEMMVDESSDLKEVYVSGETALKAIEGEYNELRQSSPELVQAIEEAANNGTDVAITVPDYLTNLAGTQAEAAILPELKADPNGVTYKEAQDFYQKQSEVFQSEVAAVEQANEPVLSREQYALTGDAKPYEQYVKEHNNQREVYARDVESVEAKVLEQFQSADRFTAPINRAYTSPIVAFYTTQAKRMGVLPSELYAKYPLRVQSLVNFNSQTDLTQTDTPAFKKWFGDSKVVDAEGKPLVVYHGTGKKDFSSFRPRVAGAVWFAEDSGYAGKYVSSMPEAQNRIIPTYLSIENPLVIDMKGEPTLPKGDKSLNGVLRYANTIEDVVGVARQQGYDGVIFKNRKPTIEGFSSTEFAVFEPTQIKSAIGNRGTFDPNDPNILRQSDKEFKPDNELIESAVKFFGTTKDKMETGYILPDGRMLDMTGRHKTDKKFWSDMRGERTVDHRDLLGENMSGYSMDSLFTATSGNEAMYEFMSRTGAMRVDFGAGVASAARPPTNVQINLFANGNKGEYVALDYIRPDGNIVTDIEIERATPTNVKKFYDEAVKQQGDSGVLAQSTFYSALARAFEKVKQDAMPGKQWAAWLNSNAGKLGVKKDEIQWTGIAEWLELQDGKVSKEAIRTYLNNNGVRVEETFKGEGLGVNMRSKYALPEVVALAEENQGDAEEAMVLALENDYAARTALMRAFPELEENDDWAQEVSLDLVGSVSSNSGAPKYASYVVPGGENYKEILLTLPGAQKTFTYDVYGAYPMQGFKTRDEAVAYIADQDRILEEARTKPGLEGLVTALESQRKKFPFGIREVETEESRATSFRSSHWEETNILAHVRFDERTDADGKRVLFINEIQSDWGQEGKKKGFSSKPLTDEETFRYKILKGKNFRDELTPEEKVEFNALGGRMGPIPEAPFVTDTKAWVSLAIKRMLRYAVDNGFEKVAFINGQQAADLYDLSKQVDSVTYRPNLKRLIAYKDDERVFEHEGVEESDLENYVGKEVAKKLIDSDLDAFGEKELHGVDLKVGGEGMRAFYDKIVPQVANDVLKKVGGGKVTPLRERKVYDVKDFKVGMVPEGFVASGNKTVVDANGKVLLDRSFIPARLEASGISDEELIARVVSAANEQEGKKFDAVKTVNQAVTITPEMAASIASGQALFQTVPEGVRGTFNMDTLTISLMNGSDLSTVIHESGHFYLRMLQTLANEENAPQEVVDDYMKALNWFGVSKADWESMTLDEQRPYHEQWAESFELWNLEGKAPTQELQPIFSKFRAWLLSVYKSVEEFLKRHPDAGKLNDEVRGVFSRLLAMQDVIQTTEAARAYQPLFTTKEEAQAPQSEVDHYLQLGQQATEDATAQLQARSLRDMRWASNARSKAIKELQDKAKAQREAIREEVTTQVMSEPVNQARTFLRTGKVTDPNTGEQIEVVKGFKLDSKILKEMYPESALDRPDLSALRGMTSQEGLDPDTVAEMFGFTSGDALVRTLISEEKPADKIAGLTDRRMLEEYGDLTDQQSIERAADEAIHNEARARFVATGLKILSKTPISVTQLNKAARNAAETQIANKKVRDLRPKQYLAAETKANKAALAAVAKDPTEAVRQQRNALLNNRLAMAAQDAVTEVEKAIKYLGKFNNEGTRKNLDLEYLEQIDAMLEPFDLRKGLSLTTIDTQTTLAEWVREQEAMGFEPTIDPEAMAVVRGKSYKNMTMTELRGLVDTVKQIEHMGRMKKKLLTAQERADFAERIAEAKISIALNANRSVPEKGTPSDAIGLLGQWYRQMAAAHRKFSSFIRELDGGEMGGVMYNLLLRGASTAANTESAMRATASDRLGRLFDKLPTKFNSILNMKATKRLIPETTISLTDEQRVMFALNWGNEGNRQRLLDGGITGRKAITPAEAQAVLDTLTKEEWDFVQGIWDFIGEYKPAIAELERTLTGKTPEWVEPSEIETRYGTYPGGYFPAKYDTVLSTRSDSLEAATDLRSAMKGAFGSAAARNGYTKERSAQVVGRPLLLNFNAISRHVNEVIHRLSWQPWLVDANRIVRALDSDLRQTLGAEATKEIQDVMIDIARGEAPSSTPVEVAINRIRTGTSIVGMGWKITTALLQPAGLTNSFARIGKRYMARGLSRYLANPIAADAWVNEHSVFMQNRGRTMNREVNEILNTVRSDKTSGVISASYFYLIGKMQRMVDVPTYIGAYERALEEQDYELAGTQEERDRITKAAHDIAAQAVKDTQGGGELMDLAKVQRGSPIMKLFTNFYSYMNTVYNMNVEAFRTTNFRSPSEVAIFFAEMVLINFLPVMMSVALKNALKGECDWTDTECLLNNYKTEQISHFFGQVLILREIGVSVDVATGGKAFGYTGPAGLRFFADLYKTGQQAAQGEVDMPLFKAANNAAGALFHYPAAALNNVFETIIAIENGEIEGAQILPSLIAGPPRN